MPEYIVIKSRHPDSQSFIVVTKGEPVMCREESDENGQWAGWIYCIGSKCEGWIPKQIIKSEGENGIILEDYDSTEFELEIDEIITSEKLLNGWIWGTKKNQSLVKGWAPLNHVELIK